MAAAAVVCGAAIAGVPRRVAVTSAAAVGAIGSLTTLIFAYREPLNRCRCTKDEVASTSRASSRSKMFDAHCARCRKRTRLGVAMSFVFSPAYVAAASALTALAAHVAGRKCLGGARGLARTARARLRERRRARHPTD